MDYDLLRELDPVGHRATRARVFIGTLNLTRSIDLSALELEQLEEVLAGDWDGRGLAPHLARTFSLLKSQFDAGWLGRRSGPPPYNHESNLRRLVMRAQAVD